MSGYDQTVIENQILDIIRKCVNPLYSKSIETDKTFGENGIDSLTFLDIIVTLEDIYKIQFEPEMISYTNQKTIDELIAYVSRSTSDS